MRYALLAVTLAAAQAQAAPWVFSDPIRVTGSSDGPCFHHLDGASRQHLSVTTTGVLLVFEDDCSGAPRVYATLRRAGQPGFGPPVRVDSGDEAWEPAAVAVDEDRWLVAFEQDGAIHAALVGPDGASPETALTTYGARQVSLAVDGAGAIAAAWTRDGDDDQQVEVADLALTGASVVVRSVTTLEAGGERFYQAYPSLVFPTPGRLVVAWEDRRAGHTRLYAATRAEGSFGAERQINEHNAPVDATGRVVGGLGSGVMRPVLAAADGVVQVVWLDKRSPGSGYAVWGASSTDGGNDFGANVRVQDAFGDAVQQWHASVAAMPGGFVATWDDSRGRWLDESELGDVMISWTERGAWSEDRAVPGASGAGYQGSPVVAVDTAGGLHLAWIERDDIDGPTRLAYLFAPRR